jgi:hypothetical protein
MVIALETIPDKPNFLRLTVTPDTGDPATVDVPRSEVDDFARRAIEMAGLRERASQKSG